MERDPGMHWSTTLRCPTCRTLVHYDTTPPPWRESAARRALADEAALWIAEKGGEARFSRLSVLSADAWGAEVVARRKEEVEWRHFFPVLEVIESGFSLASRRVKPNLDLRSVDCPACGAELFVEDAIDPKRDSCAGGD